MITSILQVIYFHCNEVVAKFLLDFKWQIKPFHSTGISSNFWWIFWQIFLWKILWKFFVIFAVIFSSFEKLSFSHKGEKRLGFFRDRCDCTSYQSHLIFIFYRFSINSESDFWTIFLFVNFYFSWNFWTNQISSNDCETVKIFIVFENEDFLQTVGFSDSMGNDDHFLACLSFTFGIISNNSCFFW